MTDRTQVLRVLDAKGTLIYKVQLPPEGRTVMLEFEEAGAVLAVVQKLGLGVLSCQDRRQSLIEVGRLVIEPLLR